MGAIAPGDNIFRRSNAATSTSSTTITGLPGALINNMMQPNPFYNALTNTNTLTARNMKTEITVIYGVNSIARFQGYVDSDTWRINGVHYTDDDGVHHWIPPTEIREITWP